MAHKTNAAAASRLQSILSSLESSGSRPGIGMIEMIRNSITDVIAILQEGDPVVKRLLLCAAVIQDSTQIIESKINGKLMQRVKIIDMDGYRWAISTIHKIAAGGK